MEGALRPSSTAVCPRDMSFTFITFILLPWILLCCKLYGLNCGHFKAITGSRVALNSQIFIGNTEGISDPAKNLHIKRIFPSHNQRDIM